MKENLKPCADKRSEAAGPGAGNRARAGLMACLLKNEPASACWSRAKPWRGGARAKASLKRAWAGAGALGDERARPGAWPGGDPKPRELPMARVKRA